MLFLYQVVALNNQKNLSSDHFVELDQRLN